MVDKILTAPGLTDGFTSLSKPVVTHKYIKLLWYL